MNNILAFAREPGGADAIGPVVKRLRQSGRVRVTLLAKDFAIEHFGAEQLECKIIEQVGRDQTEDLVNRLLDDIEPQAMLTSASSRPEDDMTEKLFWTCGARRGIPSVAVLDQWQNYALRFSGPTEDERLAFLPTWIAAMDEEVKRDMVSEGIPATRILVSGHPRFGRLNDFLKDWTAEEAGRVRAGLGIEEGAVSVCFVSEPAMRFFAVEEGYSEVETLDRVLASLDCLARKKGLSISLVLKYHPRNVPEDFATLQFSAAGSPVRLIEVRDEVVPWPLLAAADYVVGMISILLIDSVLLGKPTLSVQINARHDNRCMAVNTGAISAARNEAELDWFLESLLTDSSFRDEYLARQRLFKVDSGGGACIENKLYQLLGIG